MIPVVIWPWHCRPKEDIFVTSIFFFMATQIQLGKAIIQLRRLKGFSQESFANEAGVDRRYMSDIENGKRNVSLDILNRIASCFDLTLSTLFNYVENSERVFKSVEELKDHLIEHGYEDTLVLENPDYISAVSGINENGRLVYSYERMIEDLMIKERMSFEDAVEFIDYNTIRAIPYMGEKAPIIIFEL